MFHFLLQFASIKLRYVNFRTNLSLQSKSNVGQTYPSHFQLLCFYKLSYLALFELDFVIFMVDDSMQLPIPNIQTLIWYQRTINVKFHNVCFKTFRLTIILLFNIEYWLFSVLGFTIWYFDLVISLSNDISENPGPHHSRQTDISRYLTFCNLQSL